MNAVRRGRTAPLRARSRRLGGGRRRPPRPGPDRRRARATAPARSASRSAASRSRAPADRSSTARAASSRSPSRPSSVYAIPDDVEDASRDARRRSAPLRRHDARRGARAAQVRATASSGSAARSTPDAGARVRALKLAGIHLVAEPKRFYPKGPLAAAVLGFVGTDDSGLAGLEHLYDKTIRGKPGEIVALTDARRSRYGEAETASSRPARGRRLARALARLGRPVRGRARARRRDGRAPRQVGQRRRARSLERRDPGDGVGSGLRSRTSSARYPADVRRNRAIADCYEPGSTFKIVTGALALDEGLVSLDEIIDTGDGTIRVANTTIQEADHHRYGALTLGRRLRALLQHRHHPRRACASGARAPLRRRRGPSASGQPTGVDLPGENTGIFRPLPRWSALSNAEISMGQEVSLNALQLARITAVVANGGRLVQPHLVTRIVEPGGARAAGRGRRARCASSPRRPRGSIARHPRRRRRARHRHQGRDPGLRRRGQDRHGAEGRASADTMAGHHVPNFAGFAPADAPRCVAVVVLEEPQGKYYAADVAAPLFSRVDVAGARNPARRAARAAACPWPSLAEAVRAACPALSARHRPRVPARLRAELAPSIPTSATPSALGMSAATGPRGLRAARRRSPGCRGRVRRRPGSAGRLAHPAGLRRTRSSSPTARRRRPAAGGRRAEETAPPRSAP